jgi:uncharacterized Zn-binding protein involved in type VI secretion
MGVPVARVGDKVLHVLPPGLTGGQGSKNVLIGGSPAWRSLSPAQAAQLLDAMKEAAIAIKKAEKATELATGKPEQGVAEANELKVKTEQNLKLASMITSFAVISDIHVCIVPLPLPIHGPGVTLGTTSTVLINGQPPGRQGDMIFEANVLVNVPPITNRIVSGMPTVLVG